jgi:hypothetical protein
MKPRRESSAARGQILAIVAVAMVVLIGIAALVVDVGFSWMLRRQEQNAADPGAVAAARWLRDPVSGDSVSPASVQPQMDAEACFYAQQNGFFTADSNCAAALASDQLRVVSPPITGDYAGAIGHVQVIIEAKHPAFFGRIFGRDVTTVSTSAVVANTGDNSNAASLVALQTTCAGGSSADVDGGGTVHIFPVNPGDVGGYVHVNSPCGSSNDNICQNGVGSAALSISGTLTAPMTYVNGSCTYNGTGANGLQCEPIGATNCLDETAIPLGDPLANLPEPNLADFPNGVCPRGTPSTPGSTQPCPLDRNGPNACPTTPVCRLTPGVYYGGFRVGSNVSVELEPGMYILAGGGISLSGSSTIEAVTNPSGVDARVMIFSTDGPGCPAIAAQCQGAVTFTANQAFRAKALNAATCGLVSPQACPWKGILLWQDGSASNSAATVKLGGQASTVLAGTIYAPKAEVQIAGGTSTTGCSGTSLGCLSIQIISWRWKITGGGLVEMPYDPAEIYQFPARGLVD